VGKPANKTVEQLVAALNKAGDTFRKVAASGGHGIDEYRAWEAARKAANLAQAQVRLAFDEAHQERCAEYAYLAREANHIDGVARETGGRHPGLAARRTAWTERAAQYAGHPVAAVGINLIDAPATPRGADRPQLLDLPEIPPYERALREAAGNGSTSH
jgi:hypothetical protein